MLVAALLALEYTAPPLRLAYRRLGELDIFLLFGVFLVMGSFYLFNGVFTLGSFLISLPISFLVAAIIICNEIPDYDSDIAAGKYNLIAVTGRDTGYTLYAAAAAFSALALIANIVAGNLPAGAAFILLFYILGVKAALILRDNSSGVNEFIKASMLTIALHSAAGVSMIVALLFKR